VRRLPMLLATVALLAACSSSTPSSPSTGPALGPPASATASALQAGSHASRNFGPQVSYTVPAGWSVPVDNSTFFQLIPGGSEVVGIHLFRDPMAASQDPACPDTPEPGVGTTALELAAWIRGLPGLTVSQPKIVTVGGLRGTEIEMQIVAGWTASCSFANGSPTVPLFIGSKQEYRWVIAGSERLRLDLLDVPGGGTVVVDIDAFDGSLYDDLLTAATPIVNSFSFATS
jgi:hypothetical protein